MGMDSFWLRLPYHKISESGVAGCCVVAGPVWTVLLLLLLLLTEIGFSAGKLNLDSSVTALNEMPGYNFSLRRLS
jgi:hypothetical protein